MVIASLPRADEAISTQRKHQGIASSLPASFASGETMPRQVTPRNDSKKLQ